QHSNHGVAGKGVLWIVHATGAVFDQIIGWAGRSVPDKDLVLGFNETRRHAAAHRAETDESDSHGVLFGCVLDCRLSHKIATAIAELPGHGKVRSVSRVTAPLSRRSGRPS